MSGIRIHLLLFLTSVITVLAFAAPKVDDLTYQFWLFLLTGVSSLIFFILAPRKGYPAWASISVLFFVSHSVVNFNIPLLRLFGIEAMSWAHTQIWSSQDVYNLSLAVSSVGIACFFLGVSITDSNERHIEMRPSNFVFAVGHLPLITTFFFQYDAKFDQLILFGQLLELAFSGRILNHVIANVPSNFEFGYGIFSAVHFAGIIPFAHGFINTVLFGDAYEQANLNFYNALSMNFDV